MPIKVFGRNEGDFRRAALAIMRSHFSGLEEADVQERLSKAGRFVSLTITVVAESRAQLDVVYRELSGHQSVIMVL